jgi:hypothetical protein
MSRLGWIALILILCLAVAGIILLTRHSGSSTPGPTPLPSSSCPPCSQEQVCDVNSLKCIEWQVPTCSEHGTFIQLCGDPSNPLPCSPEDTTTRLNIGSCKCGQYQSNAQEGATVNYKGTNCQFDDNTTCTGNGIVNGDGVCSCVSYQSQAQGYKWVPYIGSSCQFSDANCNNLGTASIDKQGNLTCTCDEQTHWGPTCNLGSQYNLCNHSTWTFDYSGGANVTYNFSSSSPTMPCTFTSSAGMSGSVEQDRSIKIYEGQTLLFGFSQGVINNSATSDSGLSGVIATAS